MSGFTKFAYADAHVLEVKGSPVRQVTASLDKVSDYDDYSKTKDGFMYVRIRAISSRVNRNSDGWPSVELAGSPEILNRHQSSSGFTVEASEGNKNRGFATFVGKPIFVDHNNSNPQRGRGVIVDSKFRVLDHKTAAADDYWKSSDVDPEHLPASEVELLLEVDAKQYPKFAQKIKDGELDGFSMGANVEYTKCSHCGNEAHDPSDFCSHVRMKGAHHDFKTADGKRVSKKSYENCYGCGFFEISGVFEPADETALAREVRAGTKISESEEECSWCHGKGEDDYGRTCKHCSGSGSEPKESSVKESIATDGVGLIADPIRPHQEQQVSDLAMQYEMQGLDPDSAIQMAQNHIDRTSPILPGHGEGGTMAEQPGKWDQAPMEMPARHNDPRWSSAPVLHDPRVAAYQKLGENPLPQDLLTKAPDEVDTMRKEQLCPICGSDMDSETCKVCGYVQPPKEFDNPDLQEAEKVREEMKTQDEAGAQPPDPTQSSPPQDATQPTPASGAKTGPLTSKMPVAASVTSDMRWTPKVNAKTAARINKIETPIRSSGQTTNEPKTETVLSDQLAPVTSAMKTARRLIETAQRNHTGESKNMNARTADGPTPPGDTAADKRVDVMGVGGIDQASNEEASKAQAQVDPTGVGGTGVEGVEPDKVESLPTAGESSSDAGFNTDKTTEDSGPTKTFGDSDGTEKGTTSPVTHETPYWVDESKWSKIKLHADDNDKSLDQQEQQDGSSSGKGGTAVKGVQPIAESFGDRVNVLEHKTSPSNNSGATKTWSGTDGNGVLKQQEPVTREDQEWGGVKVPDVTLHTQARVINAMRLAEAEQELGLLSSEDKWNRIADLSSADPRTVTTRLETLAQVKTAGVKMAAQQRLATRVPRAFGNQTAANHDFERIASDKTERESVDDTHMDSSLFMR